MATKTSEPVDLMFFCDESSQINDAWCAVAGLAMPRATAAAATRELRAINAKYQRSGEVKWTKAKSFGGVIQRDYINYLFDQVDKGRIHFHIRFSPMSEYDHSLSGPRRRIDTVSKSFYQLLKFRAVRHYNMHRVFIVPDDGECTCLLGNQIANLNAAASRIPGSLPGCVQSVSPRSSASEPMLQLLDVTLGAMAAMRNGRHLSETLGVKRELAALAFQRTGWPDLTGNCARQERRLSRWNVTPSIKGR